MEKGWNGRSRCQRKRRENVSVLMSPGVSLPWDDSRRMRLLSGEIMLDLLWERSRRARADGESWVSTIGRSGCPLVSGLSVILGCS